MQEYLITILPKFLLGKQNFHKLCGKDQKSPFYGM